MMHGKSNIKCRESSFCTLADRHLRSRKSYLYPWSQIRRKIEGFRSCAVEVFVLVRLAPHHCDIGAWGFETTWWSNLQGPKCPVKNIHSSVHLILH